VFFRDAKLKGKQEEFLHLSGKIDALFIVPRLQEYLGWVSTYLFSVFKILKYTMSTPPLRILASFFDNTKTQLAEGTAN
jgi:hypothetical protein